MLIAKYKICQSESEITNSNIYYDTCYAPKSNANGKEYFKYFATNTL